MITAFSLVVEILHRTPPDLRRFIVPKKVEEINDHLFIDTYI